FENRAPRHLGNALRNHSRSERDLVLLNLISPLGPSKFGGNRLVGRRIEKWVCCVSKAGQQDRYHYCRDSAPVHVAILTIRRLTMHARISYSGRLKTLRLPGLLATSLLVLSSLRAQDAKFAADNLKYSRD